METKAIALSAGGGAKTLSGGLEMGKQTPSSNKKGEEEPRGGRRKMGHWILIM
jgi:hypothetical protein